MKEPLALRENKGRLVSVLRKDVLLLFFIVVSFTLMVVVSYYFVGRIVEKQMFANVQETIDTAEANIRSELREAGALLLNTAAMLEKMLQEENSLEEMQAYLTLLTRTVKASEGWGTDLVNVYVYTQGELFSGLPRTDPEHFSAKSRPWYITALTAKGKIGLTTTFKDAASGRTVMSLAKTLEGYNGEFLGVSALIMDFTSLSDYVSSLQSSRGGYGLLCDSDMNFIVHPFSTYLKRSMYGLGQVYSEVAGNLRHNPGTTFTQRLVDEFDVPVLVIYRQIYNGWCLGIATPVSSYYRDVKNMALILSILGFVFMVTLSLILIRLSLSKELSDEQNQGKSSFLARMSHEIRTPMNSILGMAELIRRKAVSGEIQGYLEIIHQSGENLLAIINDILDFSKIESGRLKIQNRDYQIAVVINDMINMMRSKIAEKSLDFFVDVDSSIPFQLHGDDMRLRQILTNLLSNAIKYTLKGFVSLDVRMERVDEITIRLICSVSDSGIGIKPEDKPRLFHEFIRIDDSINRGIEGTGLGLVITNALCRAMGGEISFTSEYGKGSTFRAVITQEIKSDVPSATVKNPETKKVLFYDWRPQYIESISRALNGLGISFECPHEFKEFLVELEHGAYDYAFVSSKFAMDCIFVLGRRSVPLQLVIMVEPGEMSVYQEVTNIMMPVYSISLANALNNQYSVSLFSDRSVRIGFTAPSARILIVDDISTNLKVAKELMAPYNMNIHTCMSGTEAISLVKSNHYDLIFMDHMMPGMDGIEATNFIRSLETGDGYYENLPIIALTANAVSGQREMFLENDINDFLAKPIDIQKLNDILEEWLPPEKRMEPSMKGGEEARPEKAELPFIDGIDMQTGLKNCGGSIPVYLGILGDFCNDAESRLNEIAEAFAARDTKLYITLVHALKGAARSVGAIETGDEAFWLEKTAAAGDYEFIREKNTLLRENVFALIRNIRSALELYDAVSNKEYLRISDLKLDTLKSALSEMDIKAVNRILLDYTSLDLDNQARELISEVEQLILMFEYDKAIRKMEEICRAR